MTQMTMTQTAGLDAITLRPPTWDDASALVDLLNACSREQRGTESTTVEELHVHWQDPGRDFTTDGRVATNSDGQLVGHAAVYCSTPYVRNFVSVDVHPAYRGQGIGSTLTQWGESRVRQQIDKAPADARITLQGNTLSTHSTAVQLLCDHGFVHVRSFYEMKIEMDAPPPLPSWPPGITVRSMIPNQEEEAVYRADIDAFRDHWGFVEQPFEEDYPRWLHYTQNQLHYDPSLYFLALDGDQIAGLSLCNPQDNEFPDMAWVNTVAVRRPWRRRGIALALLHHTFGEFYRRGIYKVGLGVDANSLTGATKLYEKAGMHVYRRWDSYEKELRPGRDLMTQSVE